MTGWTVDTLKEHIEALMVDRFHAQEEAIDKAAHASELRESKNNEFREQLRDQTLAFPTRVEIESRLAALEDKISSKNIQIVISLSIGFIGILIAVFNFATAHS